MPSVGLAQFEATSTGTEVGLEDIYFINENIGIAVGEEGTIIRSTDGGLTWSTIISTENTVLQEVEFFDELNGIASGTHTYITADAGETWTITVESDGTSNFFTDVSIAGPTTCYLSSYNLGLMKSTDMGQTWETIIPSSGSFQYRAMDFIDENTGFSYSELGPPFESVLKTTNGGLSWDTIVSNTLWNNTVLEDMVFLDENIGFQLGWYNGHLLKTTDGGQSWVIPEVSDDITTQLFDFDIHPDRPNSYYACGWYGEILKSTDQGDSWVRIDNDVADNNGLKSIFFLNDTLGWVAGGLGKVYRTTTGGEILSVTETLPNQHPVLFPNPTSGILNIDLKDTPIDQIEIYDSQGARVHSQSREDANSVLDLSSLAKGIYTVRFRGISEFSSKIIIE